MGFSVRAELWPAAKCDEHTFFGENSAAFGQSQTLHKSKHLRRLANRKLEHVANMQATQTANIKL